MTNKVTMYAVDIFLIACKTLRCVFIFNIRKILCLYQWNP